MMIKKWSDLLFLCMLALLFAFPARPAWAKVTLQPDFQGTVVITLPNGEISLLEAGDNIPEIPSNSMIEVFDGKFSLTTEQGDKIQVSCLDHDFEIANGGSADLSCAEESGLLKSVKGITKLIDEAGKEAEIKEGEEYPIRVTGAAEQAPPTEAGEPIGGAPAGGGLGDAPPVDSRSIESSPSQ